MAERETMTLIGSDKVDGTVYMGAEPEEDRSVGRVADRQAVQTKSHATSVN